jgi:signal transduction histidine kinase
MKMHELEFGSNLSALAARYRRYDHVTTACAAAAMMFALLALTSGVWGSGLPVMGTWAAATTFAAAIALLSLQRRPRLAFVSAACGALLSGLVLLQCATGWAWLTPLSSTPIAMICLLMLCLSELSYLRQLSTAVEWLTLGVFVLTLLELLDFLNGNLLFSGLSAHGRMTLHAAWACALLSVGMLMAQRHGFMAFLLAEGPISARTRRLLLAALLLPPLLGWLRIVGERHGLYQHNFGVALFTLCNVLGFALLLYQDARFLHLSETHRAELDEAVAQRTRQLEQANEELRRLDKVKSEFLATVTHELLTPMNAVLGFTELVLDGNAGEPTSEQREYLGIVLSSGQHLRRLIEKMLFLTRLESGDITAQREWFDVRDVLMQVASDFTPPLDRVKLEVQPPAEPLPIYSDAAKVSQVLHDLVENALKFTPQGQVLVACEAHDAEVALVVSDTGIGIREEDLDKVFQPFQQADSSYARKYEGVGLGLFTCKKIVELLGGHIEVESKPHEGTRFVVTVPREG